MHYTIKIHGREWQIKSDKEGYDAVKGKIGRLLNEDRIGLHEDIFGDQNKIRGKLSDYYQKEDPNTKKIKNMLMNLKKVFLGEFDIQLIHTQILVFYKDALISKDLKGLTRAEIKIDAVINQLIAKIAKIYDYNTS